MSFFCHATGSIVQGESQVLVPTEIREVKYVGTMKRKSRRNEEPIIIYTGDSEGWEVAATVPVCASKAKEFMENHPPKMVGRKEVRFYKRLKRESDDRNSYREQTIDMRSKPVKIDTIEQVEIGREF